MSVQVCDVQKLLQELVTRRPMTEAEAAWIFSEDFAEHRPALYATADRIRKEHVGDDVYLRGLIEFSNYCACRCAYCGISAVNREVERYRMTVEEVVQNVREAVGLGYRSFVLQSGEDRHYKVSDICRLIESLKQVEDIAVTLSIGEWKREDLAAFRAAGADRYLLRIETSDPELFARLHPDSNWHDRHRCLMDLKELGFQTGSGIMVGLPGQTPETLRRDLAYLLQLRPEMVGIGPFIPHPDTPLGSIPGGTLDQTLTFLALLRIYLPDAFLPATTAMGSIDPQGRQKALRAGANVLMPNVSPQMNRTLYELYPGKICTGDDASTCRRCVDRWVVAMGRTINMGHGHIKRQVY